MQFKDFNSEAELREYWNQLWIEREKKEGCYDTNNPQRMPSYDRQRIDEIVIQWKKARAAVEAYNALPANLDKDAKLSKWCDAKSEINTFNHLKTALIADWRQQIREVLETEYEMGLFCKDNGEPTDSFASIYNKAMSETSGSDLDADDNLDDGSDYGLDGYGSAATAGNFSTNDEKYDDLTDFFNEVNESADDFDSVGMNSASNETDGLQYDDLSEFDLSGADTKKVSPENEDTEMDDNCVDTEGINDNISDRAETSSTSAEKNKKFTEEEANGMHADFLLLLEKKNHTLRKIALFGKGKDEGVPCFFQHNEIRSADGSFNVKDALRTSTRAFFDMPGDATLPEDKGFKIENRLTPRDEKGKKLKVQEADLSELSKEKYSHCKGGPNGTVTPCIAQLVLLPGMPTNAEAEKESKQFIKGAGEEQNRPRKVRKDKEPGLPGAVCLPYIVSLPATEEYKAATGRDAIYALYLLWVPRKPILDEKRNVIGLEKRSYGLDYDTTTKKGQRAFEGYCHSMKALCRNFLLKSVAAIRKMPLLGTGTIAAATNYEDKLRYQTSRELNKHSRELSKALFNFDSTHEDCKDDNYIKGVNKITKNARYEIIDIVRGVNFMDGFRKISEYLDTEYNKLIDSVLKKSEDLATKYNVQKLQTAAA